MSVDGADGISAEFRGYVASAPRTRFTPTGETLWEFGVRLVDSWLQQTETVIVRVPDEHYNLLRQWAVPGRQVLVRGTLHPVRWQAKDGRERMRLLVDPARELTPLEHRARGSEPAALAFTDRKMPLARAIPPVEATAQGRAARLRRLLDESSPTEKTR